jgi:hypothetical protein
MVSLILFVQHNTHPSIGWCDMLPPPPANRIAEYGGGTYTYPVRVLLYRPLQKLLEGLRAQIPQGPGERLLVPNLGHGRDNASSSKSMFAEQQGNPSSSFDNNHSPCRHRRKGKEGGPRHSNGVMITSFVRHTHWTAGRGRLSGHPIERRPLDARTAQTQAIGE